MEYEIVTSWVDDDKPRSPKYKTVAVVAKRGSGSKTLKTWPKARVGDSSTCAYKVNLQQARNMVKELEAAAEPNALSREDMIHGLIGAGYRGMDVDQNIWAKPVGYQLLSVDLRREKWTLSLVFRGVTTKKLVVWDTKPLLQDGTIGKWYYDNCEEPVACRILSVEAEISIAPFRGCPEGFPFVTDEEYWGLKL